MVTIYDMASGVIRTAVASASKTKIANNDVSLNQPQGSEPFGLPLPTEEEQLALRVQEHPGTTQDNTNKILPALMSVNTNKFINDMEK